MIFKPPCLFFGGIAIIFLTTYSVYAGSLSCSITTAAGCSGTVILRLNAEENAHVELPGQSTASYASTVICCSGVTGMSNSCSGTYGVVAKLVSTTNSHIQQNTLSTYTNNACLAAPSSGYVTIAYKSSNCLGYDTTLLSMSSSDNAHAGTSTAYTSKVCASASATALPQSITFSISSSAAYFGALSSLSTRYASSTNINGDSVEVEAHSVSVTTNAPSGYVVNVSGRTLTYGTDVITQIGSTNTAPSVGAEQFGMRATTTSGSGSISSPYNGVGFAYAATATTSNQVASGTGDSQTSVFSFRYIVNIATLTKAGAYSANLVYIATATF